MRNILLDRYLSSYDVTAIPETEQNNSPVTSANIHSDTSDMRNILLNDMYLSSYDVTAIRETQKNNNVKPDFDSDIDVDIYPSRDNPLVVEDPEEEALNLLSRVEKEERKVLEEDPEEEAKRKAELERRTEEDILIEKDFEEEIKRRAELEKDPEEEALNLLSRVEKEERKVLEEDPEEEDPEEEAKRKAELERRTEEDILIEKEIKRRAKAKRRADLQTNKNDLIFPPISSKDDLEVVVKEMLSAISSKDSSTENDIKAIKEIYTEKIESFGKILEVLENLSITNKEEQSSNRFSTIENTTTSISYDIQYTDNSIINKKSYEGYQR